MSCWSYHKFLTTYLLYLEDHTFYTCIMTVVIVPVLFSRCTPRPCPPCFVSLEASLYVLHPQAPLFSCFWLRFGQLEVPAGFGRREESVVEAFILPASRRIAVATHSELQESLPTCTPSGIRVLIAPTVIIPRVLHYPLWFPYALLTPL